MYLKASPDIMPRLSCLFKFLLVSYGIEQIKGHFTLSSQLLHSSFSPLPFLSLQNNSSSLILEYTHGSYVLTEFWV